MADRWKGWNLPDSRYMFLPIQFHDDGSLVPLEWDDSWDIDAATGESRIPEPVTPSPRNIALGKTCTVQRRRRKGRQRSPRRLRRQPAHPLERRRRRLSPLAESRSGQQPADLAVRDRVGKQARPHLQVRHRVIRRRQDLDAGRRRFPQRARRRDRRTIAPPKAAISA